MSTQSTLDPIAIATHGYVCDETLEPISIATHGYVCIVVLRGGSSGGPLAAEYDRWKSPHVRRDELMAQIEHEDEEILILVTSFIRIIDE